MGLKLTRLWSLILSCLLYNHSGAVQADDVTSNNTAPLRISTNDLILKVGTHESVYITPTNEFKTEFEGAVEASLEFEFENNITWVIRPVPPVLLVKNSTQIVTNTSILITPLSAGRVVVISNLKSVPQLNLTTTNIFLRVISYKSSVLLILADIVGWIYFFAWSISFYPQIYQNWRRKSVRGLSLDFVFLNVTGFIVYGVYNIGLFWIPEIQSEFVTKYPTGEIPVQINDVIFTLLAIFASSVTLIQCIIYDKGSQTVSNIGRTLLMFIYTFLFVMFAVAISNHAVTWLTFLTVCSYIKILITLFKYVPQAGLNWSRKSTSGFCIYNVLLDMTGGIFSILQMLILGYNYNDWLSLLTDFTKFGLGFISICFDALFITQHYFLYRNHEAYEPIEGGNVCEDPYEDMVTSNQIQQDDDLERLSQSTSSSSASTRKLEPTP